MASSQKDLGETFALLLVDCEMFYFDTVPLPFLIPDLLERVFIRFGVANTDEELEKAVCRFLCPVLLKLSTDFLDVRKKVMIIS